MSGSTVPPQPPGSKQPDSGEQIRSLEQEVAQLRGELESKSASAPRPRSRHRVRTFWSVVLITIACLLAPISVVAVWANGEVSNTDRYVATVAPLASDPAIQQAVSNRVSDAILQRLDIPALTQQAVGAITQNRNLDPQKTAALTALAGAVNGGVEGFIKDKVTQVVQSPQFATLWTQANTKAHEQINAALSGENTGAVQIQNDEIVLDLGDVVAAVKTKLVDDGFTVAEKIPTVDTQIVLVQSSSISRAQTAYSALDKLGTWLPIVAVVLALIGVFVARSSRKGLLGFGIGLTLSMAASGLAFAFLRADLLNNLPATVSTAATTALIDQVTYFMRQALWAGAAAGVVLILAAILIGPTRFATGLRDLASRAAGAVQRQLAGWGATMDTVRTWVAGQAAGLRIAASIAAIAVIMLQRYKTVEVIIWATVGLLVALFVIQVLASGVEAQTDQQDEPHPV
ncbi:MAG: hypothetical protein ACOYD0_08235 [Candidatus Nanopelagicales bacterium]